MSSISRQTMNEYLSRSISSLNQNKLNGLLAEIDFRQYLSQLGFGERVSVGGWIARCDGPGHFAQHTVVLFPETIVPDQDYPSTRVLPDPTHGLHTICSTFHQIGIHSYFCTPIVNAVNDYTSVRWFAVQLGLPTQQNYTEFPGNLIGFRQRVRNYKFLRYNTDSTKIPPVSIPEEFSKENLRVTFQNHFMSEIADVDGVFWGNQHTYPIEIKEKTPGTDRNIGDFFGIDVGPFVKLAFYAAKRGNLRSIFV